MKKILIILLIFIMIMPSGSAFAENFNVCVDNIQAKAGDTAEINITLENNSGIIAALFDVEYDRECLELIGVHDGKILESGIFSPDYSSYPYKMVWNSASQINFTDDGVLVTLIFRIKDTAKSGKAFVNLTYNENNVFNVDLNNVFVNVINGGIDITGNADIESDDTNDTERDNSDGKSDTQKSGGTRNMAKSASGTKDTDEKTVTKAPAKEVTVPDGNLQNQIILTINKKDALVFGEKIINDVAPIIRNNRTMLPARFVAENLGAIVEWDETAPGKVTITNDGVRIIIYIGDEYAFINNEKVKLDSPAFIENDRTYTPVRFIAESLGAKVEWDENAQKIFIQHTETTCKP